MADVGAIDTRAKIGKIMAKKVRPKQKKLVREKSDKLRVRVGRPTLLEKKLKRAVKYIAIKDRHVGMCLDDIGEHIVRHFFKNDLQRVKSRNPIKGFSQSSVSNTPIKRIQYTDQAGMVGFFGFGWEGVWHEEVFFWVLLIC